jgi:hypothetical protein
LATVGTSREPASRNDQQCLSGAPWPPNVESGAGVRRFSQKHIAVSLERLTYVRTPSATKAAPQKKTAIQVINDMVKARLTQPEVDFLDDHGKRVPGKTIPSPEYKLLQSRGLEVRGTSIGTLRFPPVIEEAVIKRWSATWFNNARDESKQIERRRQIITTAGQEKAISKYAEKLSADLLRKQPKGVPNTLKTLVTRTRNIILEDELLRQRMTTDDQDLFDSFEEIIKWMEVNGK